MRPAPPLLRHRRGRSSARLPRRSIPARKLAESIAMPEEER